MKPEQIAEKLTADQRAELLSYEEGEGFIPPRKASCAMYMWRGIMPRGSEEPISLLQRAHGACLYKPTKLGFLIASILTTTHTNRSMGE